MAKWPQWALVLSINYRTDTQTRTGISHFVRLDGRQIQWAAIFNGLRAWFFHVWAGSSLQLVRLPDGFMIAQQDVK